MQFLGCRGVIELACVCLPKTRPNAHRDVARDLLVAAHAEGADGEAALGEDGLLLRELLQNLGGAGEAIATLADADVEGQLLHLAFATWCALYIAGFELSADLVSNNVVVVARWATSQNKG